MLYRAVVVVIGLGGCGEERASPPPVRPDAGEDAGIDAGRPAVDAGTRPVPRGREIFPSTCGPCHGLTGEGTTAGYELRHPVREYAIHVVRTGRPGLEFPTSTMAMYTEERVSDAQLGDIWDWLDSFPLPSTPEERYEDYCANCHGADGRGGPTGSGLVAATDAVFHASVRGGHGGQVFSRRAEYMPAYDESVLTEEQILEIATYIRSR